MAILKMKESCVKPVVFAVTALFLVGTAIFFSPIQIPHKLCIPMGIIALSSFWLTPWEVALALVFSLIGDYAGSCHNFMSQMGSFAVAHIFYICDFWPKRRYTAGGLIGVSALVAAATLYLMHILPSVEPEAFRYAIVAYAAIIAVMASGAILQERPYRAWYIVAATLFVFSDGAIAYGMAMGQPTTLVVMPTYYAAQAIFTVLYMLRKKA